YTYYAHSYPQALYITGFAVNISLHFVDSMHGRTSALSFIVAADYYFLCWSSLCGAMDFSVR
ncbi:MAG: hypothetical protein KAZ03_01340, partial [Thiopseudomonas sp.]|nr:hypothetical protein [Thiopseudomonas sp.]